MTPDLLPADLIAEPEVRITHYSKYRESKNTDGTSNANRGSDLEIEKWLRR